MLLKNVSLLFIWIMGCVSLSLSAQEIIQTQTLTTDDGLFNRHVNAITQDEKGFMWFGTSQGIAKYDGNNFTLYNSNRDNPNFIPLEQIKQFQYQKSTNTLWFIADLKLFALDLYNEELKEIEGLEVLKGDVLEIALDKTDNLWIVNDDITEDGIKSQQLIKYDGKAFHFIKSLERKSAGFTSLDVTKTNEICWTTINHGLTLLNQKGQILQTKILSSYNWYGHTIHFGESFFNSKNQHYYFSESKGGIDIYKDLEFSDQLLEHEAFFYNAAEDKLGGIWFTGKKEVVYLSASGDISNYTKDIENIMDFSHINKIYIDASNLLWLATDNGLIKIKLRPQNFEKLLQSDYEGWGRTFRDIFPLKDNYIAAMCESEKKIYKISSSGEAFEVPLANSDQLLKDARFFVSDTISNKAFTVTNLLIEIDFNTNKLLAFEQFRPYLNETKSNPIIKLYDGSLLTGYTLSRLIRIDPKTKYFQPVFKVSPENDYEIKTLFQSKFNSEVIWVGTSSYGLLKVNLNGTIEAKFDINSNPSLSKNSILSLSEIGNRVLVGTYGGGINVLDLDRNTIQVFDKKNGLCNNTIASILIANNEEIIAATYNGLSRINLKSKDIQNYFLQDGITNNEFNYTSSHKDENGQFYFGGMNGITKFSYENLAEKRVLPALNFTQLETFNQNKDTLIQITRLDDEPIVLSPYDINLKVEWSIPDYFNKENYIYYTRMEGFEDQWFYQGNANSIRYNKLPAGEYNLKIKGEDKNGNQSKASLVIPLIVNPIFYKTWWFISICLLVVSATVYSIFKYRLEQALAMERLRTKISSDLHDDVGAMLTGLAMQTEMLEMQSTSRTDKKKLRRLTTLSRNTITQMRDFAWSIDSRKDRMEDLVERMHEYAEEYLLPSGISFDFKFEGSNLSKKLNLNFRRNLFLIYKEAITNILKHSKANHVEVNLINKEGCCKFMIRDNGNLKNIKKTRGQGIANMKMRAESINGKFEIDISDGFSIRILLPKSI